MLDLVRLLSTQLDPKSLGDDATRRVWIEIAHCGSFKGHVAGPFTIDAKTFADIIQNFTKIGRPIPVDFEHASEQAPAEGAIPTQGAPACGWIHELKVQGDKLLGLVEWLPKAREYIKSGAYRFFSPAVVFNSRDRVTGKPIGARLSSGALTNRPFLPDLAPVAASDISRKPFADTVEGVASTSFAMLLAILEAAGLEDAPKCVDAIAQREREDSEIANSGNIDPLVGQVAEAFDCEDPVARAIAMWATAPGRPQENLSRIKFLRLLIAEVRSTAATEKKQATMSAHESTITLAAQEQVAALTDRALRAEADALVASNELAMYRERELDEAVSMAAAANPKMDRTALVAMARADFANFRRAFPSVDITRRHMLVNLTGPEGTLTNGPIRSGGSTAEEPRALNEVADEVMRNTGCTLDQAWDLAGRHLARQRANAQR